VVHGEAEHRLALRPKDRRREYESFLPQSQVPGKGLFRLWQTAFGLVWKRSQKSTRIAFGGLIPTTSTFSGFTSPVSEAHFGGDEQELAEAAETISSV